METKPKVGRPTIGNKPRVHISLTVAPETSKKMKALAKKRGVSCGLLVDDLVARAR